MLCALLCLNGVATGCARNPVTGKNQFILMSTKKEKEIDREASKQVEEFMGLVDDPELAAYVEELGQAMAAQSPRQDVRYSFNVVAMDEPNAFALPGGHIYVSRGLLALTSSEAELANILGHEVGHVAARHSAQRDALQKALMVMSVLAQVGVVAGGARQNGNGGPIGNPGIYGYSREQESEADRIGQDLAVMAGIDPSGMAAVMRSLDAATRLQQGYARETSYFDTHPATRERAAEAATSAQVRRWKPKFAIATTRAEYLERLKGLPLGPPAAEGVFDESRFLHPGLGFSLRFPHGWETHNMRAAVYGVSPEGQAVVMLEVEGPGDDPRAAALGFSEREGIELRDPKSLEVNGLEAFRGRAFMSSPFGKAQAEMTWIAYEGMIYRLSALAPKGHFARNQGAFRSFSRGFNAITEDERQDISDLRLEIVEALEGESLQELGERVGNAWEPNETAVANQLRLNERLEAGEPVKIAVRRPYRAPGSGVEPEPHRALSKATDLEVQPAPLVR